MSRSASGAPGWVARATTASGGDLVLADAFAVLFLALAVLCGAAAVALWRSTARVQRGWVHARDVAAGR